MRVLLLLVDDDAALEILLELDNAEEADVGHEEAAAYQDLLEEQWRGGHTARTARHHCYRSLYNPTNTTSLLDLLFARRHFRDY